MIEFVRPLARRPLPAVLAAVLAATACGGGGGGSPTSPPPPSGVSLSNVVEALFLGQGPLAPGNQCAHVGLWRGFPRGSRVTVKISSTLSASERAMVDEFLADLPSLIGGTYQIAVETTSQADPRPGGFEVTSTTLSDAEVAARCGGTAGGCNDGTYSAAGTLTAARTYARRGFGGNLHDHEFGHGLLGLCHVDGNVIPRALMGRPQSSVVGRFDPIERQAIEAVFRSGVAAGAGRAEFERLGLVGPAGSSASISAPVAGVGDGAPGLPALPAAPGVRPGNPRSGRDDGAREARAPERPRG